MATTDSILNGTKQALGLGEDYDAFDVDIKMHINSSFFTLNQLGIGPPEGFEILSDEEVWSDFTGGNLKLNAVKSYVYLNVRLLFDPPATTHHLSAVKEQIAEIGYRLRAERELGTFGAVPGSL